jgi:2-keto-4-pentenoate hydratase
MPAPYAVAAARILAKSRLEGQQLTRQQAQLMPVHSTEAAYEVQDAMLAMSAELGLGQKFGWKTGTAPLFECGRWAPGDALSATAIKVGAVEGEVGLVFANALPPRPARYTLEEIAAAVGIGLYPVVTS